MMKTAVTSPNAFLSRLNPLSSRLTPRLFAAFWSLVFVVFYNSAFFGEVHKLVDVFSVGGALFALSLALLLWLLTFLILNLVVLPYIAKPLFILIIFGAASASYFMNAYGIVIHRLMIQNVVETDVSEAGGLFSGRLLFWLLLSIIPALMVARTRLTFGSLRGEAWSKVKTTAIALVLILLLIFSMSAQYASFFRNHKDIRQRANPLNFIYAAMSYAAQSNEVVVVAPIGTDAQLMPQALAATKPNLIILVVGETARADHFGINGYERDTTPQLAQENIINFSQVHSCGTETAVSVPCMFSQLARNDYTDKKAKSQESVLDVIHRAGIPVYWRDNNSSCKGVCDRVEYENIQQWTLPEVCNERECFDNALLHQLDEKLATMQGTRGAQTKLIVLHQKGSHGPDYYHRYPSDAEVFKPTCQTNQLHDCKDQEVVNAFDNTIRYTDQFLAKTIEWLRTNETNYNTAMIYFSDHGESLGENGLYLHGMPYVLAPEAQKHVPMFMWFSTGFEQAQAIDRTCLQQRTGDEFTHDNLFHTLLGLTQVSTKVYDPTLDMLQGCRH